MSQLARRNSLWLILLCGVAMSSGLRAHTPRTQAQQLVEATAQKHPEVAGLELAATPPAKHSCVTIAATDTKEIGEKCDKDEFTVLKTLKPFVEQEQDGFDVTAPLHDASGKLIGTVGIDFKPQPGQTKADVLQRTAELVRELEPQIPSKGFLFQPAP